jgi:hypothetical protein
VCSSTLSLTSTLDEITWSMPHPGRFTPPGKEPIIRCIGGWETPKASLEAAENLAPTGIRSSDRSARSELLHRLSYPGPIYIIIILVLPKFSVFCLLCLVGKNIVYKIFTSTESSSPVRGPTKSPAQWLPWIYTLGGKQLGRGR